MITEANDARFFVYSNSLSEYIGNIYSWDINSLLTDTFGLFGRGYFLYRHGKWSSNFIDEVEKYCIFIKIQEDALQRGDHLKKSRIPSLSWIFDDVNSQLYFYNQEDTAIAKLLL